MAMPANRTILWPPRRRRHERTACSSLANSDIAPSSFLGSSLSPGEGDTGKRSRVRWAEPASSEPIWRCESNRQLDHVAACLSLATRWSPEFLERSSRLTMVASCPDRLPRDELTIRGRRLVMVPRRMYPWGLALLVLAGSYPSASTAAPIQFTGNVTKDFNPANDVNTAVTPVSTNPLSIGQSSWITNQGWVSGWSVQDIRTNYDSGTDTLYVGFNNFKNPGGGIAPLGQANGDPSGTATPYDP